MYVSMDVDIYVCIYVCIDRGGDLLIYLAHHIGASFSFILWGVNSKVDLLAKRVRCLLAHCQQGYFFKALVYFFLAFCYFGDFFLFLFRRFQHVSLTLFLALFFFFQNIISVTTFKKKIQLPFKIKKIVCLCM